MSKLEGAQRSDADPLLGVLGRTWGWMLALGLLYLVLGAVGLSMLFGLTIVSVLFIGVLLIVGGAAQFLETFKCTGWKGILSHLAIATLYIIAGVAVISDPVLISKLITLVVASVLTAVGIARIVMAWQLRNRGNGWLWVLLSGFLAMALGGMIFIEWPISGLFAIGLFVAVELLLQGSSYVTLALTARRYTRRATRDA